MIPISPDRKQGLDSGFGGSVPGRLRHAGRADPKIRILKSVAPNYPVELLVLRKDMLDKRREAAVAITREIIQACRYIGRDKAGIVHEAPCQFHSNGTIVAAGKCYVRLLAKAPQVRRPRRSFVALAWSLSCGRKRCPGYRREHSGAAHAIRTLLDPLFASPTSDQIIGYTRCGDSALWTGAYLAAEAFRYKVTQSPEALQNVKTALAGLKALSDVTGDNRLARCMVPAEFAVCGEYRKRGSKQQHSSEFALDLGGQYLARSDRGRFFRVGSGVRPGG